MDDKIIENIKKNIENNELNKKVEVNDPVLTDNEKNKIINDFYENKNHKIKYKINNTIAHIYVNILMHKLSKNIKIIGLEKLKDLNGSAIITSNHFNPIDNIIIRIMVKKAFNKDLYIVSQDTNLAMKGFLGFLMNNLEVIPISKGPNYIKNEFTPRLKKVLDNDNLVLIYPEEEMWLNYRLPRPCKRGTYYFSYELNKPVISCFVKIDDNQKYTIYILDILYPNKDKSKRESSIEMSKLDYDLKCMCYEKVYKKKLDYTFAYDDIAK